MLTFQNLRLIGTSHIAKQSLADVQSAFNEKIPKIVAIELDKNRLAALVSKQKHHPSIRDIAKVGINGWFFAVIAGWAEKKLGKMVGVAPGSEMLLAVKLAQMHKCTLALIDQDIAITLKRLSAQITWKEKWKFVGDILKAPFSRKKVPFDLRTVPGASLVKSLTTEMKKSYPNVYRVLVEERNHLMAARLAKLIQQHPDDSILALVGAGHEREILRMVEKSIID